MATRVLLVTFQQALRSLVLSLLPITTLTLIAWALAGSQSGNTSDPLRASIWIWLGSHLIPFHLKMAPAFITTTFDYLPLGAIFLPIISLRSSFKRAATELKNSRAARSFLTIWYAIFMTIAASIMHSETVKPILYLAPIYAVLITLISTINFRSKYFDKFRFLYYLILIYIGITTFVISISLAIHFQVVKSLTTVIEPGWIGGLLFLGIQLLYLPNIVFAAVSYFSGFGFAMGSGTLVSPFSFHLNGIPAIPILAALPAGVYKFSLLMVIPLIIFILLNQIRILRKVNGTINSLKSLGESFWIFLPTALILSYLSGGTLISNSLSHFGVTWWSLPSILIILQSGVILLFFLIPVGIRKLVKRS